MLKPHVRPTDGRNEVPCLQWWLAAVCVVLQPLNKSNEQLCRVLLTKHILYITEDFVSVQNKHISFVFVERGTEMGHVWVITTLICSNKTAPKQQILYYRLCVSSTSKTMYFDRNKDIYNNLIPCTFCSEFLYVTLPFCSYQIRNIKFYSLLYFSPP